jgi:hypothetical protein
VVVEEELPEPLNLAPDVSVMIYDWDAIEKNDYLGRFNVSISKIPQKFDDTPIWYPIYKNNPSVTEGEVLACFQL